ncbi:MAG: hypothetical protein AAGG81_04565 [Chlamydiota bacterium]
MTNELQERIRVKMFAGCLLTSDLQYQLNKSHAWKEWFLTQESSEFPNVQEIQFKGKSYLGTFFDEENITISQIQDLQNFIKSKLSDCELETNIDKLKFFVFSQVFIS